MREHSTARPHPKAPAQQRYLFIDLYRSAVIFLMLEGHVVRAFLDQQLQQSSFFSFHEFFHGLSAPAFLFGAGLTFVISTRKRWEQYHHWGPALQKRVGRFILLLGLGLALHLPYFSIRKIIINGSTADLLQLFQCDVLHCIGLGLLALHGLVFFFKTEERFYGLVLATTIAACFLTPLIWEIDFLKYVPPVLAQLFNSVHGSPFPLFPYVGFLFCGVLVSWEFLIAVERHEETRFMKRMLIFGAGLIVAGVLLDALPWQIYPSYNFWYTSPNYFFIRVGALLLLTVISWKVATQWKPSGRIWTIPGQESLFIYVLHLPLLYGSAINPSTDIRTIIGVGQSLLPTLGIATGFTIAMIAFASTWNYLKRKHFNLYRLTQLTAAGTFLYPLFTRDN